MLRRFLRDSAVYGIASVLSRGVSFLLVPLYTRALAPGDYGIVDMIVMLTSLVNLTVALEISQAVARFYGDASTEGERVVLASTSLWFTVAAYALFGVLGTVAAAPLSAVLLDSTAHAGVMRLAMASIVSYGLFYLVQNQLRWMLEPIRYAVASLAMTVVTVVVAILLVTVLHMGVRGVMLAQFAGNLAGGVIALVFARGQYRLRFDWPVCRAMLRFSLPLVPSGVGVFVALYVDRIMIRAVLSLHEVGIFGVGYRIASIIALLMVGIQGALTPLIYAHHREPETPHQLARIFRLFAAAALLAILALTAFARDIIALAATPEYSRAAAVVPLLAPALLLASMYVFAPGLTIAKRTGAVALLNIGGAVLNTVLNLLLVRPFGIVGAAAATFLSTAGVFAGYVVLSQRLYPIPHRWGRLCAALLGAIAGSVLLVATPLGSAGPGVRCLFLAILACWLLLVGLVTPEELRKGSAVVLRRFGPRLAGSAR